MIYTFLSVHPQSKVSHQFEKVVPKYPKLNNKYHNHYTKINNLETVSQSSENTC